MFITTHLLLLPWLVFSMLAFFHFSCADVGTATIYSPPYLPTACYGHDASEFPANNLFAAAGDGIWDNGASCGRAYLVRCLSGSKPGACMEGQTIQIMIVDYVGALVSPPPNVGSTMILSVNAFGMIANSSLASSEINIEFQQV